MFETVFQYTPRFAGRGIAKKDLAALAEKYTTTDNVFLWLTGGKQVLHLRHDRTGEFAMVMWQVGVGGNFRVVFCLPDEVDGVGPDAAP
jgi:hypothetical protein